MDKPKKYLSKGTQIALDKVPIEEGKIRFTIDTNRLFIDNNGLRKEITDFVKGMTEEEIRSILAPLPKFYFSSDTKKILVNDGENWIVCNDNVQFANEALNDKKGNRIDTTYAPLKSPSFSGSPTVPTPDSNSSDLQIANIAYVIASIANAVGKITEIGTEIIDILPEEGVKGIIYFVPNKTSENSNIYDEFMWINSKFERIGSTELNLSGFYKEFTITGTGNAITEVKEKDDGLQFVKGQTFLTEHPSISSNSTTGTESPEPGQSIQVIDSVNVDENGHLISYRKKTVTIPDSMTNSGTATYATSAGTATNASTSNYSLNAGTATYATNAGTASYVKISESTKGIENNTDMDFGDLDQE